MQVRRVQKTSLDQRFIDECAPRGAAQIPTGIDFTNFVVNKPWGYEYLMMANPTIEIWSLFIKEGNSTSMHCHPSKKTALLLMSGTAEFSTLDKTYTLSPFDSIIIDAGVFHQTKAISPGGIHVIEIETPPAKHDLVRLRDEYGRTGKPYEGIDKMSLHESERVQFFDLNKHPSQERDFHGVCVISLKKVNPQYTSEDTRHIKEHDLVAIIGGTIFKAYDTPLYDIADVIPVTEFYESLGDHVFKDPVLFMFFRNK